MSQIWSTMSSYILTFTPIITLTHYEYGAVQIGSGWWYVLPVDPANLHSPIFTLG